MIYYHVDRLVKIHVVIQCVYNVFIFKNNQNGCIQCEVKIEEEEEEEEEEVSVKPNDDFNDFDQDQLFDDWNESKQSNTDLMNSVYDDETEENDSDEENLTTQSQSVYKVQWLSDIKDDAAEFSSDHIYPHTKSMLEVFGNIFGLKTSKKNFFLFLLKLELKFSFDPIN